MDHGAQALSGDLTRISGYVLAGGASSRMGLDKALLPWGGGSLLERAAGVLRQTFGNVVIVGAPQRYSHLGLPVIGDAVPGLGPLGGLLTALRHRKLSSPDPGWIVLLACDMPLVDRGTLQELAGEIEAHPGAAAIVPETESGLEPLCAAYHVRLLPAVEEAAEHGGRSLKMQDFVESQETVFWRPETPFAFANANTPEEFRRMAGLNSGPGDSQ